MSWSNICSRSPSPAATPSRPPRRLLAEFGGLGPLLSAEPKALIGAGLSEGAAAAIKIAQASALRLLETRVEGRPLLSSWDALGDYLTAAMAHSLVEEVRVLFLNAKNILIANEAMWRGSVDEASVHVREVISRAIALGRHRDRHRPQPPQRRSLAEPGRHPPDPRPDRGRPPHEDHGPRPCHRRRDRAQQLEGARPDLIPARHASN